MFRIWLRWLPHHQIKQGDWDLRVPVYSFALPRTLKWYNIQREVDTCITPTHFTPSWLFVSVDTNTVYCPMCYRGKLTSYQTLIKTSPIVDHVSYRSRSRRERYPYLRLRQEICSVLPSCTDEVSEPECLSLESSSLNPVFILEAWRLTRSSGWCSNEPR